MAYPNQTYGTCEKCGSPKIYNPKTGKTFCQAKCWLQPQNQAPTQPEPRYISNDLRHPLNPPTGIIGAKNGDVDWDKISWGKCKHAFLIELLKMGKSLNEAELEAEMWADASMRRT